MTDRLRYLVDNAAGTAFLPPAWQELADALPLLLDIVDAARAVSDSAEATAEHGEALWALRDALAAAQEAK